jgi:hypothetical protein
VRATEKEKERGIRGNKYHTSEDLVSLLTKIVHTHLKPAHDDLTAIIIAKTLI